MDIPITYESITGIQETELVQRLLDDQSWRNRFLSIHGIPNQARFYPEVLLKPMGAKGDIDILAVDPLLPCAATAIQVKRVKVSPRAFETGKPNKLAAISELQRQSTLLVELGFHQVFSYVIVVVDSRINNKGEYTFDGLTSELRTLIDNSMSLSGLHDAAGFIQFEVCQTMDDVPLSTGTFAGKIHRMPKVRPQAHKVTEFVQNVIAERGSS